MNSFQFDCKMYNDFPREESIGLIYPVKGTNLHSTTILTYMAGVGSHKKTVCDVKKGEHVLKTIKEIKSNAGGLWFLVEKKGTDFAKAKLTNLNNINQNDK